MSRFSKGFVLTLAFQRVSSPGRPPIKVPDWDSRSVGTSASSLRPDCPSTSSRVWFPEIVTWTSWLLPSHSGAGALAMMASSAVTKMYWTQKMAASAWGMKPHARTDWDSRAHIPPFVSAWVIVSQSNGERDSVLVDQGEKNSHGRCWTEGQLDTQVLWFWRDDNRNVMSIHA